MRSTRWESWAAALLVGALCLIAMSGGVSLLALSAEEARGAAGNFRPLVGDRFVGAAAALDLVVATADAPLREHMRDLEDLLGKAPLTAGAWLDLALARRASGQDVSRVFEALRLSALTGPREARLMQARVAFALPFWAAAPDDLRARSIADLAGIGPYLEAPERQRIGALISLQSTPDIKQICDGLWERKAFAWKECEPR